MASSRDWRCVSCRPVHHIVTGVAAIEEPAPTRAARIATAAAFARDQAVFDRALFPTDGSGVHLGSQRAAGRCASCQHRPAPMDRPRLSGTVSWKNSRRGVCHGRRGPSDCEGSALSMSVSCSRTPGGLWVTRTDGCRNHHPGPHRSTFP